MPADTKLYLYLDPGGLVGRAASTFEPDQFAGWVPHQQITYLWPSGPWFWLMDVAGIADWVAHRLWIATIMLTAGLGVRWVARLLGIGLLGSFIAAIIYQLSPFLLPYISRTSLLLLPWAGLGWIVGLTIRATREPDHVSPLERWRDPALIALVVATVGSGNATALALIVPAPAIWLLHARTADGAARRHLVAVAAATAGLCISVSAWWVAMLTVQSRFGAPVLSYSETLADVSRNATGSETLRGLGYWLFYVRDPVAPTTTASVDYLISSRTIVISYAVVIVALVGLTFVRWSHRRFAASLVAVGMVLAVGVHPIGSSSPLMSLLSGDGTSGLALALRSSTRATPVMILGLALGGGALIAAVPDVLRRGARSLPLRPALTVVVGVLVVLNLPALWNTALVDEAIDRDSDPPAAWIEGAASLDARADGFRTMQLPGAEFGAFRWGYTVDQPLVALTDRPIVTRDLLPLGSAAAMDLLYAFDDRFQQGTHEPASVAPIARLFGADTLWLTNDAAFERFRGPRPALIDDFIDDIAPSQGIGLVQRFGDPVPNQPDVAMVDPTALGDPTVGRPVAPVAIADVIEPQPVVRAKTDVVLLSGSGDGIVDAAAAGLLDGDELIRYSASLESAVIADATSDRGNGRGADARVIVTDSNRDRAHHWRGSQDVVGYTETGGTDGGVLVDVAADQRLQVFEGDDPATQTIALHDGLLRAHASSYGEPFAYRPEDRPVMAIDGDDATAWTVGDHGDPVGEFIEVTLVSTSVPVRTMTLRQPTPPTGGRIIAAVTVSVSGGEQERVELDDRSLTSAGQTIDIDPMASGTVVRITIDQVTFGDPTLASSRAGVGFVDIDLGVGPTSELIRPPVDALEAIDDAQLDVVLTRLRVDPADPWRSDPETRLQRQLPLSQPATFDGQVTLRLDRNADDDALAVLLGDEAAASNARLRGSVVNRGVAAIDGDLATSWITPFDGAVGASLTLPRVELSAGLTIVQPDGNYSTITGLLVERAGMSIEVPVPGPDGDGRSVVALPQSLTDGPAATTLTVASIEPRTTVDRRYGDVLTLPAAVAELDGIVVPASEEPSLAITADCDAGFLEIDGVGVPISFSTTRRALLDGDAVSATFCTPVELDSGEHQIMATASAVPLQIDRLVFSSVERDDSVAARSPEVTVERDKTQERQVRLSACTRGCWLVLGEGFNPGWTAEIEAGDLGPPTLVDGGFNGWWIAPTDLPTTVVMKWTAQGSVTLGLLWSGAAALLAVLLVLGAIVAHDHWRRREGHVVRVRPELAGAWGPRHGLRIRRAVVVSGGLIVASAVLVSPGWAVTALVVGALTVASAPWQVRVMELIGLTSACVVAASVVWIERRDAPIPNAGWTFAFEHLNGLAVFAVLAITAGSFLERDV